MFFSGDVCVKKIFAIIDFRTLLYTFLFYFFNVFSVSNGKFIFDFFSLRFRRENFIECILTTVLLLLFTIIYATIIRKIETAQNGEYAFFAVLLVVDPLLKSIRFNIASLIVLIITIILCVYLYTGKSLNLKIVLVAAYMLVMPLFCPEVIGSYTSIVVIVFGVILFGYEKDDGEQVYKKRSKQNYNNIKQFKKVGCILLLLGLLIFLSIILNKHLSSIPLVAKMIFSFEKGAYFSYKDIGFWLAVIPYIGILVAFISKYFYLKNKREKFSLSSCFIESKYLIFNLLVFAGTLIGILVFENYSGLAIFNVLITLSIMLIARYDPSNYAEVMKSFSAIYRKHKFMLWTLFIIWFVFEQYQFRYTLCPDLSHILDLVGGRL